MTEWGKLSPEEQKKRLVIQIKNAISLDIYSNVCYLLNFCGMSQDTATELAKHYNAINEIISDFAKQEMTE